MNPILKQFREDEQLLADLERNAEKGKARCRALDYEDMLVEKHCDDSTFATWDSNRALDLQEFDYLFWHRERFGKQIQTWLEIIATKITHIRQDGEDGYFKKLEKNVGWKGHITPMVFSGYAYLDNLIRCGLWSHAKNSRRVTSPICVRCASGMICCGRGPRHSVRTPARSSGCSWTV